MTNNIESLNTRNEQVLIDIESNLKLMTDLKRGIDEQKNKMKQLNVRLKDLENKFKKRKNEFSTQTTGEKPVV